MTQSIDKNATDLETFINIATRIAPTVQDLAIAFTSLLIAGDKA